ncbi:methyl-accepting chemotaxis protein [Herbaspirillum sp. RV1423]|uniref:methyl-accepting chemotaxis protein n=1 Tax=Herbaspirillum sp. RV1423 TaxID=1443993 RepID=UPI0004B8F6F1|nr:methyl-accepting chemotaxis protein [Herbaspirillum sp. RV1423]
MKNMKIGARLSIGFVVILMLMVVMLGISVWRLQQINAAVVSMTTDSITNERNAVEWLAVIRESGIRTLAIIKSDDAEVQQFFQAQITAESARVTPLRKKIEEVNTAPREVAQLAEINKIRDTYQNTRNDIFKLKKAGNLDEVKKMTDEKFLPLYNAYAGAVAKFRDMQRQEITDSAGAVNSYYVSSRSLLIILGVVELALGGVLAWLLTVSITRPLTQAVAIAETVAAGDLTSHIDISGKDETGKLLQALKTMNDNLLRIVGQVRSGTDTIATASSEIASGNLDLSSRTEQQAGSLEETASAMEELTSTVKQNADNARQANQLAVSASEVATQGGNVVGQVVDTMGSINDSSKKIVDIISVIDGIAFQTNILALNAAVEAARAGEQGRGFAVVASEVRSLAQRSSAAAKEIKTLIDDSVSKVDVGSKLVQQAGETMSEVVASVKRVTDIVGEISAASQEQSAGINEVGQAITQMDESTQQNAALVEQAAAAAKSLQDQAGQLAQVVSVFKLDRTQVVASR